ncbi:MAG: hypothetical protein GX291_03315 [Tissierellia bacterium]|jgi:hypothetical protein|nr:hypothetical protein [Bacillota bacterium]NLK58287.1 hypothetical protein [Tissierellia bacterium]
MKDITRIANILFSIAITIALIGGGLVGLLFLLAVLIGGNTGESLAVFTKNDLLPQFIRIATIAMLSGLVRFYADNFHPLSLNTDEKK